MMIVSASSSKHPSAGVAPSNVEGQYVVTLHPKPSSDPADPLNWTSFRKLIVLIHVCVFYFLFTFLTTATVPTFAQLQEIFHVSYAAINYTVALPALSLAISPLMWSPLADRFGRRTIMIAGCFIAFISTIGSALSKDYSSYMLARFLQGWGVGPASSVGLQMIQDIYFEHERGQKTGFWTLAIDLGLLFGPLVGGFAALVSTEFVAWLTAIFFGALLLSMTFFMPETAYPRNYLHSAGGSTIDGVSTLSAAADPSKSVTSLQTLAFINLRKIPGLKSPQLWDTTIRFIRMFAYPNVAISIIFFCWGWYWFILCVITMLPGAYPTYTPQKQGLLFLGLIIGTLIAEVFFSGSLSDRMVAYISRKKKVPRTPEMRLWFFWPASILTSLGLVLFGLTIQHNWHWAVGQVAMAIFGFGVQIGNTTATTYAVDCHPEHVMDVIVFYSFHLNMSAFASPFFIVPWVDLSGWAWCFGEQAVIVAGCTVLCVGFLQVYGQRMREWKGPLRWTPAL